MPTLPEPAGENLLEDAGESRQGLAPPRGDGGAVAVLPVVPESRRCSFQAPPLGPRQ